MKWYDNLIQAISTGWLWPLPKGGGYRLSTYEEFMLIISIAGLIIMILNYRDKQKK